jgi:hypothetical protein
MSNDNKPKDKYWICNQCAEGKGWIPPTGAVTIIMGVCGHCHSKEERYLTPTCDFKRPGHNPVWD